MAVSRGGGNFFSELHYGTTVLLEEERGNILGGEVWGNSGVNKTSETKNSRITVIGGGTGMAYEDAWAPYPGFVVSLEINLRTLFT